MGNRIESTIIILYFLFFIIIVIVLEVILEIKYLIYDDCDRFFLYKNIKNIETL